MATWVFPGQGSQFIGMGRSLFDQYRELTRAADGIVGFSLRALCLGQDIVRLNDTRYTQPAIFTVSALAFLQRIEQAGERPEYAAGHSLGEVTALFAAGAFDLETGLRIVKKRGELMSEARGGAMAAVIGLDGARLRKLLESRFPRLYLANYNTPEQVAVSGPKVDVEAAVPELEAAGARCILLPVSCAFHSPYMEQAQDAFRKYLRNVAFKGLECPVISNVYAQPYDAAKIGDTLASQLTRPVRWVDSIRYLLDHGETEFVEVGPGNVLTRMIKDISRPQPHAASSRPGGARAQPSAPGRPRAIGAESLGSGDFKSDHGLKYAYVAGAMFRGVASTDLVVRMGKSGMLAFFGTGGLALSAVEAAIAEIKGRLAPSEPYGMNLLNNLHAPEKEEAIVDLYLKHGVHDVEASAYMKLSPALARYRLKGLRRRSDGSVECTNRIMAKVSRPEVARQFMLPAPGELVNMLLQQGRITTDEAACAPLVPIADDVCMEADSAGHTDQGVAYVLLPAALRMRDEAMRTRGYRRVIRIGAGGGIGTPEAAGAAFVLGADFIVTGSINQCTVEAGTSNVVKDMLQEGEIQDTDYAPAGDMFELGAKVQVWRKGVFFPSRANRLFELYQRHGSLEELDSATRRQLEEKYFRCSCADVYGQCKSFFGEESKELQKAEHNPKHKMALVFRWYLAKAQEWALAGDPQRRLDYQIHCGPALGAFNQWVRGTPLQTWQNRRVDDIAVKLMDETARLLGRRLEALSHAD